MLLCSVSALRLLRLFQSPRTKCGSDTSRPTLSLSFCTGKVTPLCTDGSTVHLQWQGSPTSGYSPWQQSECTPALGNPLALGDPSPWRPAFVQWRSRGKQKPPGWRSTDDKMKTEPHLIHTVHLLKDTEAVCEHLRLHHHKVQNNFLRQYNTQERAAVTLDYKPNPINMSQRQHN